MTLKTPLRLVAGASIAALVAANGAQAATGTLAGSTVNNTATVGYSIGGVAQPIVSSSTASFVVDKKANVVVAEVGGLSAHTNQREGKN